MPTSRSKRPVAHSPKPSFSADDILAALEAAAQQTSGIEGASVTDLVAATGWTNERVSTLLKRAIAAGTARYNGRAYRPAMDGALRPVPVYAVVKAA